MGWSTTLITSINYHKKTYNDKYTVEMDLRQTNDAIEYNKKRLAALVNMTEPKKFMCQEDIEEHVSPLDWINSEYTEIMESLEELYYDKWKLELLLEDWDKCHNENNIAIPLLRYSDDYVDEYNCKIGMLAASEEDLKKLCYGEKAFIDGSYIKTIYDEDTTNKLT